MFKIPVKKIKPCQVQLTSIKFFLHVTIAIIPEVLVTNLITKLY